MIQKRKPSRAKILIVENEPVLARDLKQSLNRMGYRVAGVVPTRKEAVQWIHSVPVDLVLIDIQLKKKTGGIHASKDIQSRFDVPVVFLSDFPEDKVLEQIQETTSYGFLLKPHKDAELESEIEIALSQHRRRYLRKHEEERFRLAVTNTGFGVLTTDERGHVSYVNDAGLHLLRIEKKKLAGKPVSGAFRFQNGEARSRFDEAVRHVIEDGDSLILNRAEWLVAVPEGPDVIQGRCDPLTESGRILGMVMVFHETPPSSETGERK